MKIGTQQLKYKVENILYENHVKSGRRRIAGEIVDTIIELMGDDMNKSWNLAHDFPEHLEKLVRRLENGLKFNLFPRTEEVKPVYEWILEQEARGMKLEKFIAWAMHPDRIKYAGKYRSKPLYIQADYPQAFITNEKPQTVLER